MVSKIAISPIDCQPDDVRRLVSVLLTFVMRFLQTVEELFLGSEPRLGSHIPGYFSHRRLDFRTSSWK